MSTNITSVSPKRLNTFINRGKEINLIDVRTPAEYRAGHASGAKLLPLNDLDAETVSAQARSYPDGGNQTLYLICQSGSRARQAAERLAEAGHRNLALVEGGTEAWEKAGLPIQRCGNAISLERQVQIAIGILLVLKVLFGFTIHELFFAATALIGAGLIVAGTTRWCGLARLIALMPWNRNGDCTDRATA